jgi:hypothetical protein
MAEASMDAEFLREKVGAPLSQAVAAACNAGASNKIDYIADWLLNRVSIEEANIAAAERAAVLAAEQAAADAAAAAAAEAAATAAAVNASAVADVADGAECLRCDELPESLRPPLPGAYGAAIDALLSNSAFSAAYVAEADFGTLEPAEPAEGEEPAEPAEGCTLLRYVTASQGFVVGQELKYGEGVSLAAADSGAPVKVPNVLLEPSIKFLKRERFGAYACVPVTNPLDGAVIAVLGADTLLDGAELADADVATMVALAEALGKVHAAGVAKMQAELLEKLVASPPVVGEYAEPDAEPEPTEPTEEEAEAAAAKMAEWIAAKKAEGEAAVEEGAEPPEFDEAAATTEYEAMLEEEKAAAILAEKTAASEAAAAAKTALDEDLMRLAAYDKTQLATYGSYEDSDDAGISMHILKATLILQAAKPSEVRQWLPLLAKVSDAGFKDSVLAFDAAAVLPKQVRARAQALLKVACNAIEIPVEAPEPEEGEEPAEPTVEVQPAPLVGAPLPTLLLAALAVAALDMQKARRVLSPLEDEDGEDDEEPIGPEADDTPWLYVTLPVEAPEPVEGEEPAEPEPGPTCRVLYIPEQTPADVLAKVASAKKGPIPTEGMMLLGADDVPLVEEAPPAEGEEAPAEGAEPKTLEGFAVEAGATLKLAPVPEPEPEAEAEEGGAE